MSQEDVRLDRRRLLASLGAASAVGLAGCTGGDGGSDGGDGSGEDTSTSGDGESGDGSSDGSSSDYPSEDIELTVPYATGGGFDAYARISAPYWEQYLPNEPTVTVNNVVGGGGVTGATQVYNAQPNGYRFLIWDAVQAVTQQIGRDVGYDIREMSHIGAITQAPNCLISMNSSGIESWDDLVNNITEVNFATQGVGALSHTGVALLGDLTGAWSLEDVNFVHYGGTGEALAGLERGEAQVFVPGTASSGLKVVESLEAEMTILFGEEVGEDSIYHGVPLQYSANLDVENMDQYADLTVFRRFFTGPPEVPEDVLSVQRDAFQQIIEDQEFLDEAMEKGRPIVDPGPASEVEDVIQQQFDVFGSDPLKGIIRSVFES